MHTKCFVSGSPIIPNQRRYTLLKQSTARVTHSAAAVLQQFAGAFRCMIVTGTAASSKRAKQLSDYVRSTAQIFEVQVRVIAVILEGSLLIQN